MIVSRPIGNEVNDLLYGHEQKKLMICNLEGEIVLSKSPPEEGWTHNLLEVFNYDEHSPYGWDAYLGTKENWIGSSEV